MLFRCDETCFSKIVHQSFSTTQLKLLAKQGVTSAIDFLLLKPQRYDLRRHDVKASELSMSGTQALIGRVGSISRRSIRKNLTLFSGVLHTKSEAIPLVWFNQHYILDKLKTAPVVVVFGKRDPNYFDVQFQVSSFEFHSSLSAAGDNKTIPIYRDIKGVSNKGLVGLIQRLLQPGAIQDILPEKVRCSEGLMESLDALKMLHFPTSAAGLKHAIQRLSFDELFVVMYPRRSRYHQVKITQTSVNICSNHSFIDSYLQGLPYRLTSAQRRVWANICNDFEANRRVFRLIQGDVGSGKTDVAILSMLAAIGSGYQSALLAPTEILAEQHYLKLLDRQLGIPIYLLKGRLKKKERQAVLDAIASPVPCIVVGTHALVQQAVLFHSLGVVVIDEQHRFGVFQRQWLLEKSVHVPHCLFMTATPIPRTLMLAHYGDLDHDIINEMPPGRTPVKTYFGKFNRMNQVISFVRVQIHQGHQAYVVYPLIESSEHLADIQPAVDGYQELATVFHEFSVGLLHGQMSNADKQQIMADFKSNKIHVLVSTTVIEVGVDVPNATVIVLMHAERFGLSQLHQLRGRVGRGAEQSHCFLVANPKSPESKQRIQAMLNTTNGFELSEEDLKIRGPGQMLGVQQSGELVFSFADALDQAFMRRVILWCDNLIENPNAELDAHVMSSVLVVSELLN
jgi:ATP-dependent DNA helicase RecG